MAARAFGRFCCNGATCLSGVYFLRQSGRVYYAPDPPYSYDKGKPRKALHGFVRDTRLTAPLLELFDFGRLVPLNFWACSLAFAVSLVGLLGWSWPLLTHFGSRECSATTTAHAEFSRNTMEKFLSQNLKRKATYRLAYSLSVDARQETDMPLLAFPA
jgi:hypothetical protein